MEKLKFEKPTRVMRKESIKEYRFNTGVRPYDYNPPAGMTFMEGFRDSGNGVYVIPFTCEKVPNNFKVSFASDILHEENENLLRREILSGRLLSKYVYFKKII